LRIKSSDTAVDRVLTRCASGVQVNVITLQWDGGRQHYEIKTHWWHWSSRQGAGAWTMHHPPLLRKQFAWEQQAIEYGSNSDAEADAESSEAALVNSWVSINQSIFIRIRQW